MLDQWELPEPKLIVSIVGGARRFEFAKTRINGLFKQGLLDIATTTGVLIVYSLNNHLFTAVICLWWVSCCLT